MPPRLTWPRARHLILIGHDLFQNSDHPCRVHTLFGGLCDESFDELFVAWSTLFLVVCCFLFAHVLSLLCSSNNTHCPAAICAARCLRRRVSRCSVTSWRR